MRPIVTVLASATLVACAATYNTSSQATETERINTMELGSFSVSLAVKNIQASRAFYETLGFSKIGGEESQNWLILQNGTTTIGLFQGMFEQNLFTFNPGWNHRAEAMEHFQDVRDIQRELKSGGLELLTEADESSTGPANLTLLDPDGNMILVDQHVPAPTPSR